MEGVVWFNYCSTELFCGSLNECSVVFEGVMSDSGVLDRLACVMVIFLPDLNTNLCVNTLDATHSAYSAKLFTRASALKPNCFYSVEQSV